MTSISHDPSGFYTVLGLAPGASLAAIKTAYRARVKAVHPDRNPSPGAREEFQRLVQAYGILRDVVRRAEYDATGSPGVEDDAAAPASPFACCRCGHVTAQPRYVVLHEVKSYLLWARTSRVEGIFCRDCADAAAARASTATWAWGWWSPPGLILTPLALIRNLLGGTMPGHVNARILIRQARAFLARGELGLASAVARQAGRFARVAAHRRQIADILRATNGEDRRLKDRWRPWTGGVFAAQLLPLAALPLTIAVFWMIMARPWDGPVGVSAGITVEPPVVGEIRHVAVDALKLRQAPQDGAPVLTLLDRFTAVTTLSTPRDSEWVEIKAPSGLTGYVPTRNLYGGSGDLLRHEWCDEHRGVKPTAGETLIRRASGEHQMMIHNDGRTDAVVKLKTPSGNTVLSYYVPATYHLGVGSIPAGTYRIEFATGSHYSRACGLFVDDMRTLQLPFTLTLRHVPAVAAALAPPRLPEIGLDSTGQDGKRPALISLEQFVHDD